MTDYFVPLNLIRSNVQTKLINPFSQVQINLKFVPLSINYLKTGSVVSLNTRSCEKVLKTDFKELMFIRRIVLSLRGTLLTKDIRRHY